MSGLHIKKLNHVFAILRYVSGKIQYRFFAESEIYIYVFVMMKFDA